ncbi:MAG: pilus assembly protein HicB [Nocardioides sp.]|nr:pilus assembly protein HicB [Nocardioides sp.]
MDVTPYVEHLRRDLQAAAESGGEELRSAAERLGFALDPATRLALMEAISQACAEITAEMPAGGVDVRLDGRELAFVVDAAPVAPEPPAAPAPPAPPAPPGADDDVEAGATARITLRLPESVKSRAEDAAAEAGQSVNTWLVNVIRAATQQGGINVNVDLSSIPFGDGFPFGGRRSGRRMNGWV